MRIFKPLQLSLQQKTFSWLNKNQMAVSLLLGFHFDSDKEVLLDQDIWKFLANKLGQDGMLDFGMPKPQGEVIVLGNYYAPGGNPVKADRVQLIMGPVDKSLAVIGNRYWRTFLAPTEPESFTELPISYEYAFGGKSYDINPIGKGLDEIDVFGEMSLPMPNIENPDKLITSKTQRPDPAGLSPLDMTWQYRSSKMGTYDENWKLEYFPGYAPDLDWTYFNVTPSDQWIAEYWKGDETFQLMNMHPDKIELSGKLPAFRTRCFVQTLNDQQTRFSEIDMRAETTFLFPDDEIGILLFRGTMEVAEDDAADVKILLAAYEDLNQPLRTKDYYEEALNNRLDESKTFKYMMYTKDIIPQTERCGFARMLGDLGTEGESELANNLQAKADLEKQKALEKLEQEKQQLKEKLQAAGIDPAPYLKNFNASTDIQDDPQLKGIMETLEKILPGITSENSKDIKITEVDFDKFNELTEKMDLMAEEKKDKARQQMKDLMKKVEGTEAEKKVSEQIELTIKQMDELQPLPRPSNDETIQNLKAQLELLLNKREETLSQNSANSLLPEMDINFQEIEQQIADANYHIKELYRSGAHYIKGRPPHSVPLDIVQYRFQKMITKGESVSCKDWSGLDFSGLDLSGVDLSECYLEYANFSGAKLISANLKRAILTHANLSNADLTNAVLEDSNLGASQLTGTVFSNSNFAEGILSKANLSKAIFSHCNLSEVNFLEASFKNVKMDDCQLKSANFLEMNFLGSQFIGCELSECNFLQSQLENCDFSGSNLSTSNFIECNLNNSAFTQTNMTNVRFLGGSTLKNCNFREAILDKASFRNADAEGSNFEKSTFYMADFGDANLQRTKFYGAQGKRAMLMKADLRNADFSSVNLMEGSLMKARLTGANLSYSNLYSVEFMGATIGSTDFTGANLDLTEMEIWRPSSE